MKEIENLKKGMKDSQMQVKDVTLMYEELVKQYEQSQKSMEEKKAEISSLKHELSQVTEKTNKKQERDKRTVYHINAENERLKADIARLSRQVEKTDNSYIAKALKEALASKANLEKTVTKQKTELESVLKSLKEVKDRFKQEVAAVKRLEQKQKELEQLNLNTVGENLQLKNTVQILEGELSQMLNSNSAINN